MIGRGGKGRRKGEREGGRDMAPRRMHEKHIHVRRRSGGRKEPRCHRSSSCQRRAMMKGSAWRGASSSGSTRSSASSLRRAATLGKDEYKPCHGRSHGQEEQRDQGRGKEKAPHGVVGVVGSVCTRRRQVEVG